jgi:hypothetical protein
MVDCFGDGFFVCGVLAIVLPLTFSIGVAALLGWLFVFAAIAHLAFGTHFGSGTLAWHAFIAACTAWLQSLGLTAATRQRR